jgi:uncharacterized protein
MTLLPDTGPLVAAIDRSDRHHARSAALPESAEGPPLVPATVIVEACWQLEERPDIEAAFLTSAATGELQHVTITAADLARTAELARTYADLPPGTVDAPVIAVAERLHLTDAATLDRRHLTVVRPKHHRVEPPALTSPSEVCAGGRPLHSADGQGRSSASPSRR